MKTRILRVLSFASLSAVLLGCSNGPDIEALIARVAAMKEGSAWEGYQTLQTATQALNQQSTFTTLNHALGFGPNEAVKLRLQEAQYRQLAIAASSLRPEAVIELYKHNHTQTLDPLRMKLANMVVAVAREKGGVELGVEFLQVATDIALRGTFFPQDLKAGQELGIKRWSIGDKSAAFELAEISRLQGNQDNAYAWALRTGSAEFINDYQGGVPRDVALSILKSTSHQPSS